jgi:DNA-binding IclR family transcriptional regulator
MKKNVRKKGEIPVPGLSRGLAVMEFLSSHPQGNTQMEIAEALALPISSVARITLQLEATGWLRRDPDTKSFSLTMKMLMTGQRALFEKDLIGIALPEMRALRDKWLDTVVFGVMHDCEIVTIENCAGKRLFRFSIDPGHRSPLHCTAPGKAIAAYLPDTILDATLSRMQFKRYNSRTITGEKAFRRELALVRQNGYATDDGEQYNGIYCVGSALLDRNGYPVATIWITGPVENISEEDIPKIGADFRAAAARISSILGHPGGVPSA